MNTFMALDRNLAFSPLQAKANKDFLTKHVFRKQLLNVNSITLSGKIVAPVADINNNLLGNIHVVENEPVRIEDDKFPSLQDWLSALLEQYGSVAAESVTSEGTQLPTLIQHKYPLHFAAMENDIKLLNQLLQHGYFIDQRDNLDSTPLHVAVMSNHLESVQYLIAHGADVNAIAYDAWNALDLAIIKEHYPVAEYLVHVPAMYVDSFTMEHLLYTLFNKIQSEIDINEVNSILNIIQEAGRHAGAPLLVDDEGLSDATLPVSVILKILASMTEDSTARHKIYALAEEINTYDTSEAAFLDAKLLLHVLPVDGVYEIKYGDQAGHFSNSKIQAEGHFGNYTTAAATLAVEKYYQAIGVDNNLQKSVFGLIYQVLLDSAEIAKASSDNQKIQYLHQAYLNNTTILLPTGWDGHFVTTVIDHKTGLFIVCNTGMAYSGNESGSIVYKMHHPEKLTEDTLKMILNNQDQFTLEYDLQYTLGLEKLLVLPEPPQTTGNCGWRSIEVGVEAVAFLVLVNEGYAHEDATALAHDWYIDWYQYTATDILKEYLANDPRLGIEALGDILIQNHPTLFDTDLKIDPNEWARAELIIDALSSEYYQHDFSKINDYFAVARPELQTLVESHGFTILPAENLEDVFGALNIEDILSKYGSGIPMEAENKAKVLNLSDIMDQENELLNDSNETFSPSSQQGETQLVSYPTINQTNFADDAHKMVVLCDL